MAIQSSYYTTDGTTRTYPSSKHIASKLHVAVYFQTAATSGWSIVESSQYELVNNSIVFYTAPVETIYSQIEIRVADTTAELEDSPSDIAIVAGAITDVINVSNNISVVENVNNNMWAITTVSANTTNLNSIVDDVIPNLPEILLADDNAVIATAKANEASASAILAQGYAESIVPSSLVKNVDTIVDLATINPTIIDTDNVFVKDLDRGGLFVWSSTDTANGGTVFAGLTGYWVRQYSGAVNVKWFGAKGDGVTDDTTSVQLAIDNSNGSLEVPDGEFILTTVTIDSNISIFGSGTFKRKENYEVDNTSAGAANTTMFDIIAHNIEVKFSGITFDGNEQNQAGYEPSGTLIRAYDLAGTATSVLKIDISNCTFKNQTRSSLAFKGSETTSGQEFATVTNCWFSEGRKGIGAGDPRAVNLSGFAPTYINANDGFKVNVDNCKFTFTQTLSAVNPLDYAPCGIKFTYVEETLNSGGSSGIITNNLFYKLGRSDYGYTGAVDGNNGIGVIDAYTIGRDIIIQGNRFIECYESCVRGKTNIDGLIVDSNMFHDCHDTAVSIGPKGDYSGDQIGRIVISNNIVRGADTAGIGVVGESTVSPAYAGDISIIGNMISGMTNINSATGNVGAIVVRYGGRVVISDNNIYDSSVTNMNGIMVKETADVLVSSNKIGNVGSVGIFLNYISDRATIIGNDVNSALSTGIYLDSLGTPDVVVSDNTVSNVVNYGVNISQGRYVNVIGNNVTDVTGSARGFLVGSGVTKAILSGNMTNATNPTFITIGNNISQELNSWNHTINQRTAAPTSGTWVAGDIVYNTAPASAGYVGWVCTVSGTPGTWKGFGVIA